MSEKEVLLLGYYGFGNFGDDLLFQCSQRIASRLRPGATQVVRVPRPVEYLDQIAIQPVRFIPFGARDSFDIILHGGGGTFFDFNTYSNLLKYRNRLVLCCGQERYVQIERAIRLAVKRPRLEGDVRLGVGIGFGGYAKGSPRFLNDLPILHDFKALWLRDDCSMTRVTKYTPNAELIKGSDLVFLRDQWYPKDMPFKERRLTGKRVKVGLVIRDWGFSDGKQFVDEFSPVLEELSQVFDLTIFSMNPEEDRNLLSRYAGFRQQCWEPSQMSVKEFLLAMQGQDLLITSRAHGAICGACIGLPAVILDIEPKLEAVHSMLPSCTRLVSRPFGFGELGIAIEELIDLDQDHILADLAFNAEKSEIALARIERFA